MFPGLHFSVDFSTELKLYINTDWGCDSIDKHFATSYCIFLGDSLILWRSKKQILTYQSSPESEYQTLTNTTAKI